jgi:adenylylsulfate kinase-like enzyme
MLEPKIEKPCVTWITGLAGAGKSTIAARIVASLQNVHPNTVLVDGDSVRAMFGHDVGYDIDGRRINAFRISRLCKILNDQGHWVVCSTMSMFPEIWAWNREHIASYLEVYLKVSWEELQRRDKKGLYSTATQSIRQQVVGLGQPIQEPVNSHLILENNTLNQVGPNVAQIMEALMNARSNPAPKGRSRIALEAA